MGKGWRTGGVPHFTHERRGVIGGSHVVPPIIGELLKQTPKATGRSGPGRGKAGTQAGPAFSDAPTLEEMGIDKKTSSLAQRSEVSQYSQGGSA